MVRLCRGSLHELQVKLQAPLTGRPNQIPDQHTVESYGFFYDVFYTGWGHPPLGKMRRMILSQDEHYGDMCPAAVAAATC